MPGKVGSIQQLNIERYILLAIAYIDMPFKLMLIIISIKRSKTQSQTGTIQCQNPCKVDKYDHGWTTQSIF